MKKRTSVPPTPEQRRKLQEARDYQVSVQSGGVSSLSIAYMRYRDMLDMLSRSKLPQACIDEFRL